MVMTVSAGAVDWLGKTSIGIRGPFVAPLTAGKDYKVFGKHEPFMMGLNGGLEIKHGLSQNVALAFSISYAISHDDTTATSNQSFKMQKKANAYTRLNGVLTGLMLEYYLRPDHRVQPYGLAGVGIDFWRLTVLETRPEYGLAQKDDKYRFSDFDLKVGAGISYAFSEKVVFDIQGRMSFITSNLNISDRPLVYGGVRHLKDRPFKAFFEPSVGLVYCFGGKRDTDKDGVQDKLDKCPDTPKGAIVDIDGCPLDSDGDGIYDGIDQCPDTPKGALVDIVGCPMDSDKDGVPDGIDKCPDTPLGVKVDIRGCPLDTDGDGVPDFKDKCPNTPKVCKADVNGCPIDTDKDGVPDGIDRCPTTPAGVQVDSFGCPINVKPPVKKITLHINYKSGSYDPDAKAKATLDDLAETMKAYTGTNIEIHGFTDDVGKPEANMTLSQKRADAVMQYLVSKGVEPARMTAKGFGEDPQYFIADNKTAAGKAENRRVEIISTGE
jgi:outer membrane protein OmpA-like peptidoglycan-associated protein/opacity protein-like surface antigen